MKLYKNLEQKLESLKNSPKHREYIESLIEFYEENRDKPTLGLDYDTFMIFFDSGSRAEFEKQHFAKRSRLSCATMLYLLFKEEKYLKEICNMIWLICGEIHWALPAHLAGRRMDRLRNEIDLTAAETAAELAEIDFCLGDALPSNIRGIIRKEISDRIFSRFENESVYWETKLNNWAAVCGGGVGMAYMLIAPERFEAVKPRLLAAMETFLASYSDDGCCLEGVSYWSYGFSSYLYFADLLYHFSDGKEDIRHSEKIDKIATYIQNVMLRKKIPISFSDASRSLDFKDVEIISYLYTNYEGYIVPDFEFGKAAESSRCFYTVLRKFLWWNPEIKKGGDTLCTGWKFFKSAQWYINRLNKYSFAAKGGHNDEPHNHNDIGSFIFATDKGQILADIGSMEYTRDNFNENRYKFLQNASFGHSVPMIGDMVQLEGKEYCGEIISYNENEFKLKINGAYGEGCPEILREFSILDNGVVLKDTFGETDEKITERFISVIEPRITEKGVEIGDCIIKTETTPVITSQTLMNHQVKPETIYIIDYEAAGNEFSLQITVKE